MISRWGLYKRVNTDFSPTSPAIIYESFLIGSNPQAISS